MRDTAIHFRLTREQRDLIDRAATLLSMSRSDFTLEAACERAKAVVSDQVLFRLDDAKFRRFTALLDAPPTPNADLKRLMSVRAPWSW